MRFSSFRPARRSPAPGCPAAPFVALFLLLLALAPLPGVQAAALDPQSTSQWIERIERAGRTSGEQWTVLVKDLNSGRTILEHHPDLRLVPASNRKIITSALALERFGPEYKFSTELGLTQGLRTSDGQITSSLVLRSEGDPTLSQEFLRNQNPADVLRSWVAHLETLGLKHIQGTLYIDASAFGTEQQTFPAVWDPVNRNQSFAAIPSALALGGNVIRVSARPSSTIGNSGRVSLFPSSTGISLVNLTRTVGGRADGLEARFSANGRELHVSGRLGSRAGTQVVEVPVARPLDYVREILIEALADEHVEVKGGVKILTDPREAGALRIVRSIARHDSPPLPELLGKMMKQSDNFLAEQIWRATAHRASGSGTLEAARRNEQLWLAKHGLPRIEPGYDGSGLSRMNRISAAEQVGVLQSIFDSPYGPYLLHSLPVSGRSGTLRGRSFGGAPGRVFAKTGTLSGVGSLSGFITDKAGRPRWVFSMIGNARHNTNGGLTLRQNQIMKLLLRKLDGEEQETLVRAPDKRREKDLKVYPEQPS